MTPEVLVRRFYDEVWNRADEAVAREILHPEFVFRASLGPERLGQDGFLDYLREVHAALQGFTCVIEEMLVQGDRAAARMSFRGRHVGRFFEVEPTWREIAWAGGAFFRCEGGRIAALWVLGDVDAVKRQLAAPAAADFGSE